MQQLTMLQANFPAGQPFDLHSLSELSGIAGDPDWEYPLYIEHGVPLGVDEEIQQTPGVWPTMEEAKGQEDDLDTPEPPKDTKNYNPLMNAQSLSEKLTSRR